MDAKIWLKRGIVTNEYIKNLMTEQTELQADILKGEISENMRKRTLKKFQAYEKKLAAEIERVVDIKMEIMEAIGQVSDITLKKLLLLRYISFKKWEDVAEELHYDQAYVHRTLHPKALKEIEKIIKK